jgi:NAD(P)-dependent dehydrogenase (short-subunit alcohol dehydrogenase family)
MATPEGRTKDGFETQLGTNFLSHFLLFLLLRPVLLAASVGPRPNSRVVFLSSIAHRYSEFVRTLTWTVPTRSGKLTDKARPLCFGRLMRSTAAMPLKVYVPLVSSPVAFRPDCCSTCPRMKSPDLSPIRPAGYDANVAVARVRGPTIADTSAIQQCIPR